MTTALDRLNKIAAQHTIEVGDPERLMDSMAQAIPDDQILREGPHNSIQAAYRSGGGLVAIEAVDWLPPGRRTKRFRKYTITDDGCGMGPEELFEGIGWLSPKAKAGHVQDRFGVGAKLAGLKISPAGIEYITWDGVHPPIRAILYREGNITRFRPLGANGEPFVVVPKAKLPEQIRKAGHGTRLTLIGHHEEEDTFTTMFHLTGGRNKGSVLFLNARYAAFPDNVNLSVSAIKNRTKQTVDPNRTRDVVGLRAIYDEVALQSGVVDGDGYRVRWYWLGGKDDKPTGRAKAKGQDRFKHGDNCLLHSLVAVTIEDREVPGLWEIYDLRHAQGGASLLDQFGLGGMSKQFGVIIEITDRDRLRIEPNVERAGITSNGRALPLVAWGNDFRNNMPEEVFAIRERYMQSESDRSVANIAEHLDKAMRARASLFAALVSPLARFRGTGAGVGNTPGGHGGGGGDNPGSGSGGNSGGTEGSTGGDEPTEEGTPRKKRKPTAGGGEGTGPGGQTVTAPSGGEGSLNVVLGFKNWNESDEEPPDDDRIHAKWLPGSGLLLVNFDSVHMNAEAALVLEGRTRISQALLTATKNKLATEHVELGATWINKITLMENARDGGSGRRELDFADQTVYEVESLSEWAITGVCTAGEDARIKNVRNAMDRLYPKTRK